MAAQYLACCLVLVPDTPGAGPVPHLPADGQEVAGGPGQGRRGGDGQVWIGASYQPACYICYTEMSRAEFRAKSGVPAKEEDQVPLCFYRFSKLCFR